MILGPYPYNNNFAKNLVPQKNAQFLPQLTHVVDCDWWEKKKKKVVGPCESNRQPIKV